MAALLPVELVSNICVIESRLKGTFQKVFTLHIIESTHKALKFRM